MIRRNCFVENIFFVPTITSVTPVTLYTPSNRNIPDISDDKSAATFKYTTRVAGLIPMPVTAKPLADAV